MQSLQSGHSEVLTEYLGAMARSDLLVRQCHADRQTESSDMLLYLAGVNEHAVLRTVGIKRWSVAHFLRTIQYLFELPSSRPSNLMLLHDS